MSVLVRYLVCLRCVTASATIGSMAHDVMCSLFMQLDLRPRADAFEHEGQLLCWHYLLFFTTGAQTHAHTTPMGQDLCKFTNTLKLFARGLEIDRMAEEEVCECAGR